VTLRALRSVLLTPNLLGADGVSCLSRQIVRALPDPAITVSLHDPPAGDECVRAAGGDRVRFVADAMRLGLRCDRDTAIVCSHVHLAPVARMMAWRGARVTYVLCGIEAWVGLRAAERWALTSGRLVAISAHTARGFRSANPAFRDVAIEICHPGLPARDEESLEAAGDPAALIVGRMSAREAYKGHEELLRAWPRVLERHPRAQLWMVGDGDDRPRLAALAAQLGVASAITFTGRVDDVELDRRYRRCLFFVMPSRHEGFGLVFLEAMRAGKACIGAPGAAEEIIQHGVTGLIVDAARAGELSSAVVRLFDDPALCDAFGRAGAARFRAEFTDARFAARFAPSAPAAVLCAPALKRPVS
jgi:phosphatidylinositol alpha-1,6-mannosyltransferase